MGQLATLRTGCPTSRFMRCGWETYQTCSFHLSRVGNTGGKPQETDSQPGITWPAHLLTCSLATSRSGANPLRGTQFHLSRVRIAAAELTCRSGLAKKASSARPKAA